MTPLLVGDIFTGLAVTAGDRTAAVVGECSITFGEMVATSTRVAHALASHAVAASTRVVHWADPAIETMPVFVALARMGAVYAPISSQLGVDEAAAVAGIAEPSLVLVDAAREDAGAELSRRLGVPALAVDDLSAGVDESPLQRPDLAETDPHVIFFTSGSTGRPKGVVLSHRVSVLRSHPGALLEPRGAAVIPYPLFHMAAWTQAMQQWHARATAVFTSAAANEICVAIDRHRAARVNAIPAVWRRILDHLTSDEGRGLDLSSVRFADSGTSATPPDLLDAISSAIPDAAVRIFYGATETGAATMLEPDDIGRKPGSAGRAAPLADVRIGASGELQVRGPQVFEHYYANAEATAAAFDGEWYRTGDVAEMDEEGFVTIVGRLGELIRTGGESVLPGEVEGVLRDHPQIADVAVVGVPDDVWGEVVCAAIVVADGAVAPSLDELTATCAGRLARFKHPRRLIVLDAIPRTPATGQVERRRIVASAVTSSPA
jgi:acyl-CoA synthetase (AMP-forming)/AMP-acid ligase II